jgi:gamma-glutamylaminecyclotransferase
MKQEIVFVYGSLKKGYFNHSILKDSEFICKAITMDSGYDMVSLGSFPAMVNNGCYDIHGEVYSVNNNTLNYLDALESNGSFYTREKIGVAPTDENTPAWLYAWAYMLSDKNIPYSKKIDYNELDNSKQW